MSPDQVEAFVIDTYRTLSSRAQADQLGVSHGRIQRARRRLLAAGRVASTDRAYNRPWKPQEDTVLVTLLQLGYTIPQVAKELRRGIAATYNRVTALGGADAIRRSPGAAVRTATSAAQLFGVECDVLLRWIARGWLAADRNDAKRARSRVLRRRPSKKTTRAHYLISDDALQTFIGVRDAWPAWDVASITDADWREYARDVRQAAGGEWLRVADLAKRTGYTKSTVIGWWNTGQMPGVTSIKYGAVRFFWSADLTQFVPPADRPTYHRNPGGDPEWLNANEIGARFGRAPGTVHHWHSRGYLANVETIVRRGVRHWRAADLQSFVPPRQKGSVKC